MLKKCLTVTLVAAALGGALAHSADFVTASGMPLKTGFGECVRTGYWTPASEPCEAPATQLARSAAAFFAFGSAELDDEARAALDELLDTLGHADLERVTAVGHADAIGSDDYNERLSERRADAVRDYLLAKGLDPRAIVVEGKGKREPVTEGACDWARDPLDKAELVACLQPDRRVEVDVVGAPRELTRTAKRIN